METYREAIRKTVRPGDVVLDVGTGSGVMGLFACEAGAARVYAVDKSDVIVAAKQVARDNGLGERIVFIQGDAREIHLPEPVDVIVSELISLTGYGEGMEEVISVCRDRFLRPEGRFVPRSVGLFVAPVDAAEEYQKFAFPNPEDYGIDFSSVRDRVLNGVAWTRKEPKAFLAEAACAYQYDAKTADRTQHPGCGLTFSVSSRVSSMAS